MDFEPSHRLFAGTSSLNLESFKIGTNHNNAGRFNCLRQPGQILHNPNVYHRNLHPLFKLFVPGAILHP